MKAQYFIMSSLFFFDVFGVGFYFTNLQLKQQQMIELHKEIDDFFKEYDRNVNKQ